MRTFLIGLLLSVLVQNSMAQTPYLEAMQEHQNRLKTSVLQKFLSQVRKTNWSATEKAHITTLSHYFVDTYIQQSQQLMEDYKTLFLDFKKDEDAKNRSGNLEPALKWATEIVLSNMAEISEKTHQRAAFTNIKNNLKRIRTVIDQLALTDAQTNHVTPSGLEKLAIIPYQTKGIFKTFCSTAAKLCMNESVTDVLEEMPDRQFMRQDPEAPRFYTLKTDGTRAPGLPTIPENAAFLITMNHDHSVMDLKYVRKISRALGIPRNALLTTREVWSRGTQDENTLFIQDQDLSGKITETLKDPAHSRVAVSIYPEGNVPFSATQFPVFAKFGAYIMVRKAAVALQDQRPVYLIDVQSNLLQYSTSKTPVALEFTISEPELVPTEPLAKRDAWSEKKRLEFEARANSLRTRSLMVDLNHGTLIPGTNTRAAVPIEGASISCKQAVGQ